MPNKSVKLSNGRSVKMVIDNIRRQILRKQIEIEMLKSSISSYKLKLHEEQCAKEGNNYE